jgi:outer membrane protein assembly factor BamD (BamD/ComL family)
MKRILQFIVIFFIFIGLSACQTGNEKLSQQITALEKELIKPDGTPDKVKADLLVKKYESFAEQYPKDSLTPRYLHKAAEILMNTGDPNRAIALFEKVDKEYPQYPKAPECLFMIAFVYETNLNKLDKAREYYMLFLKKYPTHDFADDAQAMLSNLGKSPEELIREFEARNQEN